MSNHDIEPFLSSTIRTSIKPLNQFFLEQSELLVESKIPARIVLSANTSSMTWISPKYSTKVSTQYSMQQRRIGVKQTKISPFQDSLSLSVPNRREIRFPHRTSS